MRRSIAALCLAAVALLPARSRNKAPDSLFDAAGYHARGDKVYYLSAFPGKAPEIAGADATSFKAFDTTYAKDKSKRLLRRPPDTGCRRNDFRGARPRRLRQGQESRLPTRPVSDDPAHFELLDGGLSKNSTAVYWTDGGVLSDDPAHFAIVSNNDHYLFTKDSRTVHVNGKPIADADPATFRVLNAAFECSADAARVLSAIRHRRRGSADVPAGPRCHEL